MKIAAGNHRWDRWVLVININIGGGGNGIEWSEESEVQLWSEKGGVKEI